MKNNRKKLVISIFLILILSIGIVYAYLTGNLYIGGSTKIVANNWDIHFANLSINDSSVSATRPASIDLDDNTSISYEVVLNKPGDYYEFSVDIVNAGTIPGKINLIANDGISSEFENIIDYEVKYENGLNVEENNIINANSSKRIKVRVYFKEDIDIDDLPSDIIDLNLSFDMDFTQSNKNEVTVNDLITDLLTNHRACFTRYTDQITEVVGQTVDSSNVYFDSCEDKRNVIINNMCFQIVRTTETGGLKIEYNGEAVDNKCEITREDHKGISGINGNMDYLDNNYLYGSSFTYDLNTDSFLLNDTFEAVWSDSTYENLIGKYTCKSLSDTCTDLYSVNSYYDNRLAYTAKYTIGNINFSMMGTSFYNANDYSPAMVGYMYNKVYKYKSTYLRSSSYKFGNSFTYNNGIYTLSGITQDISGLEFNINNTHYTCFNTSGECNQLAFVYYSTGDSLYYIELTDGKGVDDALNEMLYDNKVNRYDSSVKGIIDAWYRQNLLDKTNMLEDIVYCNERTIKNYGGWDPNVGDPSYSNSRYDLLFKYSYLYSFNSQYDLTCPNITDQFSTSNNMAKLTYPVALLNVLEGARLDFYYSKLGLKYWLITPSMFGNFDAEVRQSDNHGDIAQNDVNTVAGIRPVVSLASYAVINSGDGSEANPWIVE